MIEHVILFIFFLKRVCFQVVNIFNLFITYGDTFLPSPGSYDELYYELIRMQHVFEDLYSMGMQTLLHNNHVCSYSVSLYPNFIIYY